jgi:dolichol-phosphate mannosyltransferase
MDRESKGTASEPMSVAVVIPCYRVKNHILEVVRAIGPEVSYIICVDDKCPEGSGRFVQDNISDPRLRVIFHEQNRGVGGAMISGYKSALETDAKIVVKIDGDGQMDIRLLPKFIRPISENRADYTKGNRFINLEYLAEMPSVRIIGNAMLSFLTKLSSGYWNIFDPTNGYTALHVRVLRHVPLAKLNHGYFFESDMLFRLNMLRAVVLDIPAPSVYGDRRSNLQIARIVGPFLGLHTRNCVKRIIYNYFLYDFNIASLELTIGMLLTIFGTLFGLYEWIHSASTGISATSGTVMLAALPILVGAQMIIGFFNFDIQNVPRFPVHSLLD